MIRSPLREIPRQNHLLQVSGPASFVALLLLLMPIGPAVAGTSLKEAQELLMAGQYAAAEKAFAALGKKGQLPLARLYLETGRPGAAAKLGRRLARGGAWADAMTLVGEAHRRGGQLKKAIKALAAVHRRKPKHLRARAFLGLVYHEQGQIALAKTMFDAFYDEFGNGTIDKNSAAALTYVAMACRYTDNHKDSHDTLRDALKIDPNHTEAWLELGEISLEKYEAGPAEQHFLKVLGKNPKRIRALVGMARVKTIQTGRMEPLLKLLARIRAVDPNNMEAAALEAAARIDNDDYAGAEKLLKAALKRNPNHLEALSVMAASHFVRDDLKGYLGWKKQVFAINPRYTRFFHRVIKSAVRKHRYRESVALGQEAAKIDTNDWNALAEVGINYLRLGEEKLGLRYLKQAWQGDQYNVRVFNILNLFEDELYKSYGVAKSKHFRLRAHKSELALLARTVLPLLEQGYTVYQRKYGFSPKGPISVELFKNPKHFAVRTFGLPPDPGAIGGVCFGRLITALSPTLRRFNWGQVLWHELNHTFTVELSKHRVPRWFTEGLAVMEPPLKRREWKRENDRDIHRALVAGRLPRLNNINTVFTRRGLRDVLLVYYQGGLYASFFARHFGMKAIRRALAGYAQGQRTEQILPRVFGKSLNEIDTLFQAEQRQRLKHYQRGWYFDGQRYGELERIEKSAKARPNDPQAQLELAAALLVHRKRKRLETTLKAARKAAPKNKLGLYLAAQLQQGKERELLLVELQTVGGDGYGVRMQLASLALARKDEKAAVQHLRAAKSFDRERYRPSLQLARIYHRQKQKDKMLAELKRAAELNQQSFSTVWQVVNLSAEKKDWAAVRRYGEMAYYIYPAAAKLHQYLAKAYEERAPRREYKRAAWHLETALLCSPKNPKVIHADLARVYGKLGKKKKAAKHQRLAK